MGRSVQIESAIQQYAESCVQSRVAAEVGTLVGRCASGKDLVLQALKTPNSEGVAPLTLTSGSAAKKGSTKGGKAGGSVAGSGLQLDDELVVEHAAMVDRLLPGGLDVVGFYLVCPAAAFSGATSALAVLAAQALKELGSPLPSLLLLHIDSVTGALSLKEAAATVGSLRPCDTKVGPLLDQLVQLQSRYDVSLQLPVTNSKQEVQAAFQAALDSAAARLKGALGLVEGQLATADAQLADVAGDSSSGSALGVELLLPPASSLVLSSVGSSKAGSGLQRGRAESAALGGITLQGCLDCRACVHRREAATAAVDAIKADIRRSLQARMDALLDAAEQQQEAAAAEAEEQRRQQQQHARSAQAAAAPAAPPPHPLFTAAADSSKALVVSLPRRAFVGAAGAGTILYCDYLYEGESTQALLSRLQLLLPLQSLAGASVECLEQAGARAAPSSSQGNNARQSRSSSIRAAQMQCTLLAAGSAVVAVLALGVGYYMSLGGH